MHIISKQWVNLRKTSNSLNGSCKLTFWTRAMRLVSNCSENQSPYISDAKTFLGMVRKGEKVQNMGFRVIFSRGGDGRSGEREEWD